MNQSSLKCGKPSLPFEWQQLVDASTFVDKASFPSTCAAVVAAKFGAHYDVQLDVMVLSQLRSKITFAM
eukprot:6466333-Amphidinium_carterae.3